MSDDKKVDEGGVAAPGDGVGGNIGRNDVPANIEELMHHAYLRYSLSVNVGRAIPDVRDGLKPGMRRILYAMRQLGLTKSHAYTKCAKVVGEVIGNYHPHGDQAVYDTLVRMAQEFSMRAPLIDGQGNFGSIDGDAPAAYRYTECRLERLAEELLADLDKNTVDMRPNFDESTLEPEVLPARFPNLLVNGSTGIGVGMATNIPPHNLGEVIDATVLIIDRPTATVEELMQVMPGPDFPTGGELHGVRSILELYETGRGSLRVRGKAQIVEKDGKERIIITELPYAVNKEHLVSRIAELVNEKTIPGISDITDESSSRTGIRIVIEVKRNAMASMVLNQVYQHTLLQTTFGAQFLVMDRNRPRVMTLRQILQAYIDHRLEVITRRAQYDLERAEARAHILDGLLIAVKNIDEVVAIIRGSRTRDEAGERLMERFQLSKKQTAAILEMRLHQLTGLAIDELQTEYDQLQQQIAYLTELLASREKRIAVVRQELLEVRQAYSNKRRTEIKVGDRELGIEDLIAQSVWVVTMSARGYIKRVAEDSYRTQNRGGVGVRGMQTKDDEDYVQHLLTAMTHDYLLFFTNRGQMHWLKTYEIPEGTRDSTGRALVNLLELAEGEQVRAMIPVSVVDDPTRFVVMATRNGTVKKTRLDAFKNLRRKAIWAILLDEGDDLIEADLTDGQQELLLSSEAGMACRFRETDCRTLGRMTRGVRGMQLRNEQGELTTHLVAMTVVNPAAELLVVTVKGMGKRSRVGSGIAEQDAEISGGGYRLTRRGGKGVISIRLRAGDRVVQAIQLDQDQDLLLTSVKGQVVRIGTAGIRTLSRNSQGVRVMRLREDDEISVVTTVARLDEEEAVGVGLDALPTDEGAEPVAVDVPETEEIEDLDDSPLPDEDIPEELADEDDDAGPGTDEG
jgi:DNA gyrase subunit A